jgi:hypothetical protein
MFKPFMCLAFLVSTAAGCGVESSPAPQTSQLSADIIDCTAVAECSANHEAFFGEGTETGAPNQALSRCGSECLNGTCTVTEVDCP